MLTMIEVFSPSEWPGLIPPVLELPIGGEEGDSSPIQVLGVVGLNPVTASVSTTPFGSFKGEAFTGTSVGKRNIVLTLGFNPDWTAETIEGLRKMVYEYLMTEKLVTLRFTSTHLPTCEIDGYVESCEPNMFSKDPQMQVSIICPLPDFIATEATVVTSELDTDPNAYEAPIQYQGSVPTGFVLEVRASAENPGYTDTMAFTVVPPDTSLLGVLDVTLDLVHPSRFYRISTVRGQKYIREINMSGPDEVETNMVSALTTDSDWPQLYPGENKIQAIASELDLPWELTYFERFGGL